MPRRYFALAFIFSLSTVIAAAAEKKPAAKDSIRVTVTGTLRTGIFAIGGETTGATITARGITWELEFGTSAALRKTAQKLNGKKVLVQGSLERRKGVEIKERFIVTVTHLQAAGDAKVSGRGKLGLRATVGRSDARIRFLSADDKTIFDVTSRTGIDRATIRRETKQWPKTIFVRLHLSGLESFTVGSDNVTVEWSVSSTGKNAKRVSLRKDKKQTSLDEKSPYYTEVRMVGGNGRIPLKGGHFEVQLPAKLFEGNPPEITLRWIDFYRN